MMRLKDRIYSGLKINRLTAIEYSHTSEYKRIKKVKGKEYPTTDYLIHWKFKCDCGNYTTSLLRQVFNNTAKSCGCLQKEKTRERLLGVPNKRLGTGNYEMQAFNKLYGDYKISAYNRGYEFRLTKEEFKFLNKQDCVYCGKPPSNIYNEQSRQGYYVYNGVDRRDNNLGYIPTNCYSCCTMCNRGKGDNTEKDTWDWIKRIVEKNYHLLAV